MAHISVMQLKAVMDNTTDDNTGVEEAVLKIALFLAFCVSPLLGFSPIGYWLFLLGSGLVIFMFGILLG